MYYKDAMGEADKWLPAMEEEMSSLREHNVWELVDLPEGRQPVKCKWVYLIKRDTDNRPIRYKARLVAKGYSQIQGVDYEETFAPVARLDTLRLLLNLAAVFDLEVHQIDIKTAYLHGNLEEEIYMEQPEGFVKKGSEHKVCRLNKAIYGLKQAGRQWFKRLRNSMKTWGFSEFIAGDITIFTKIEENGDVTIILIYVDDMAGFASSPRLLDVFKAQIATEYKFSDMGEISHFLGLRITRNRKARTLSIDQQHYIDKMIQRFDMQDAPPRKTPLASSTKLVASENPQVDPSFQRQYQSIVGSLMYAMLGSRPDICFTVNKLSQFGSNPNEEHMAAAIRVLQYLKATRHFRLMYSGSGDSELIGYSDSDWASDPDTRRSTTGYTFQINGGTIAWATQKQRTVALSSTEAEYMALTDCTKHASWTIQILDNLHFNLDLPISIYADSKGARDIANNNVFHKRTKHIDIRYHFVREKIHDGMIRIKETSSSENIADIFTKSLPEVTFWRHVNAIGLVE